LPRGILVHRDQARHAAALGVGAAHEVARALGGDHDDIDVGRRHDLAEADVEAVREEQGVARRGSGRCAGLVHVALLGVGQQNHDQIRPLGNGLVGRRLHLEPGGLGLRLRRRPLAQADDARRCPTPSG
jgi:hypothetical protein